MKCIIVLGMYRGGTSAMSGTLQQMGVYFGENLMEPSSANPKGFFEHNNLHRAHVELLELMGTNWHDTNYITLPKDWEDREDFIAKRDEIKKIIKHDLSFVSIFGIKGPRIIHFLPLYEEALKRAGKNIMVYYIVMDRNVDEVAESVKKNMNIEKDHTKAIYDRYKKMIANEMRYRDKIIVQFDDLINDTKMIANKIAEFVGEPLKRYEVLPNEVTTFLEKDLKHYNYGRGNF